MLGHQGFSNGVAIVRYLSISSMCSYVASFVDTQLYDSGNSKLVEIINAQMNMVYRVFVLVPSTHIFQVIPGIDFLKSFH